MFAEEAEAAAEHAPEGALHLMEVVLENLVSYSALGIEALAVLMIIGAVIADVWELFSASLKGELREVMGDSRLRLAKRLVLTLEFLIAADILKSIGSFDEDSWKELLVLGGIIVVRTVLTVTIAYELREEHDTEAKAS